MFLQGSDRLVLMFIHCYELYNHNGIHNGIVCINESRQYLGFSLNEGNVQIINTVKEENKPFFTSAQWQKEAYEQIKITETEAICKKGCNRLYFYGMSPAIVLERIVLWEKDKELPESYLGPTESFFEK